MEQFIKHCSSAKKTATWNSLSGKLKIATTTDSCYELVLQVVEMYSQYKLKGQVRKQTQVQQVKPGVKKTIKKALSVPAPPALNTRLFERLYNLPPEAVTLVMTDIIAKHINIDSDLTLLIDKIKAELFITNLLLDHIRFSELYDKEYEEVLTLSELSNHHVLGRLVKPSRIEQLARNYCTGGGWADKKYAYKIPQKDGQRLLTRTYKDAWDNENSFPPSIKDWILTVKRARAGLVIRNDSMVVASEAGLNDEIVTIKDCKNSGWTEM